MGYKSLGTVLISGGAGYVGNILVNKLFLAKSRYDSYIKNGLTPPENQFGYICNFDKLIVIDNLMYKQNALLEHCYRKDFEFVYGDVRNIKDFQPLIEKANVIVPLAAIVGADACNKDKSAATLINELQIKNIVRNTIENPPKIIYPNTNSGYGIGKDGIFCKEEDELNPISHYGITKCNAERYLTDYKAGISLRLATVMGLSNKHRIDLLVNDFTYKAFKDKYIVLFEKDFKRNYIHVQDVAMTMIYMMNRYDEFKGEVFNVGLSSANLSKHELCLKIKEYLPEFSIQFDEINSDPDKRDYIVSNAKLEATGWKPYYTLDDTIQELIKGYSIIKNINTQFTNL